MFGVFRTWPAAWRHQISYARTEYAQKLSNLVPRFLKPFLEIPITPKAIREPTIHLFWKAGLLVCFHDNKKENGCELRWLKISPFCGHKGHCVAPESFDTSEKRAPRGSWNSWAYFGWHGTLCIFNKHIIQKKASSHYFRRSWKLPIGIYTFPPVVYANKVKVIKLPLVPVEYFFEGRRERSAIPNQRSRTTFKIDKRFSSSTVDLESLGCFSDLETWGSWKHV